MSLCGQNRKNIVVKPKCIGELEVISILFLNALRQVQQQHIYQTKIGVA